MVYPTPKRILLSFLAFFLVALTLGIGSLFYATSAPPNVSPLNTSVTPGRDWQEVLSHPQTLNYRLIHAGNIHMDRNDLLQHGPDVWTNRYKPLPVLSHWVEHPKYGEILIDVAFSDDFDLDSSGNYSAVMAFFSYLTGVKNSLNKNFVGQLPNRGADVKQILITHFHPDHTSGLDDLPTSIPVAANLAEFDLLARILNGNLFERRPNWLGIDFNKGVAMPPFNSVVDLYGDASIFAIATPGHTSGHTSYLINSKAGAKLIVGDASHFSYGLDHKLAPAAIGSDNIALAADSLAQLLAFKAAYPAVEFILGHELPDAMLKTRINMSPRD